MRVNKNLRVRDAFGDEDWAVRQWDMIREFGRDKPNQGIVYFVRVGKKGPVKIGFTRSTDELPKRLVGIQVGNPHKLNLETYVAGSRDTERRLHRMFSHWRMQGEWFQGNAYGLDPLIAHLRGSE